MWRFRGFGLGATLIVVSLVATLGLFLGGLSVSHLGLMSRDGNQACAGDMARRVVNLAIAELYRDKTFGAAGNLQSLSVPPSDVPQGSEGLLSFDPNQAHAWGIPPSTNNLTGRGSVQGGSGKVVPLAAVDLIAVGRCRGVTRQLEVILAIPPYPWAIACDGPIISGGDLQIGASMQSPSQGLPPNQLDPSGIVSNASGTSITLGPNCQIEGNLQAVGISQVDPSDTVSGQIDNNHSPEIIPGIDVNSLDPSPCTALNPAATTLTGRLKANSDVHYTGNITLQGAVAFVAGNLTVDGSINGTGMLAATGNITVGGQVLMTASDQVALVSAADLTIQGQGAAQSSVRGILYAEKGMQVSQLDLEGSLIGHQASGGPLPTIQIDQCHVLQVPDLTRFSYPVGTFGVGTANAVIQCGQLSPAVTMGDFVVAINRQPDGSFVVNGRQTPGDLTFSLPAPFPDLPALAAGLTPAVRDTVSRAPLATAISTNVYPAIFTPFGDATVQTGPGYPGMVYTVDPSRLVPVNKASRVTFWGEQ